MSDAPAPTATPIRQALSRLLRTARGLAQRCRRVLTAPAARPAHPGYTPARTTAWLAALARTLAGDCFFCHPIAYPRFPGRYPALSAKLRAELGLPCPPPRTETQRAAARLHYMRRVFTTQPTAAIATRLARRLGLTAQDPAWPHALAAIATPPALLARTRPPARPPRHKPRFRAIPLSAIRPITPFIPPRRVPSRA